jgi:hypothetical protein
VQALQIGQRGLAVAVDQGAFETCPGDEVLIARLTQIVLSGAVCSSFVSLMRALTADQSLRRAGINAASLCITTSSAR